MDSSTHLYRSNFRPFRDRPDIIVPGRWYWCPEGARALPFWHAMGSYTQDSSTIEGEDFELGEIPEWEGTQFHVPNPRYGGQHWCGTPDDWQLGAVYGQTIPVDAEGVPLCCQSEPMRPGGGAVIITTPVFSLSDALYWLNPDVLSDLVDGTTITEWPNSDRSINPAIASVSPSVQKLQPGVALIELPPHGARNSLQPTHSFSLGAAQWYMVGGGVLSSTTHNGVSIQTGQLPGDSTFVDNLTEIAVSTQHAVAVFSKNANTRFGIYQAKFNPATTPLLVYLDGTQLVRQGVSPGDKMNISRFLKSSETVILSFASITHFSEYLLFDRVLSFGEDTTVLRYLALKYNLALGPTPWYFGAGYFPLGFFGRYYFWSGNVWG
jgi:hypothetical protein